MKPGMGPMINLKPCLRNSAKKRVKKQYFNNSYFIAAHPGCEDGDMINWPKWLKANNFRLDQVQTFTHPHGAGHRHVLFRPRPAEKSPIKAGG